jgi:2-methylcitrate dehydratase PrpD
MTAETSITERFADFSVSLKYEDLPAEVVRAAKHAILDLRVAFFPVHAHEAFIDAPLNAMALL